MKNRIVFMLIVIASGVALTGLTLKNQLQDDTTLELPTIMRLILKDMDTIDEGIYTQNFQLIEQGAAAINQHPPLSGETRKLLQETLGKQMTAFSQYDNLVHSYADSIKTSAVKENMTEVLDHYKIVQQGCVNCHDSFQNKVRQARLAAN